MAETADSTAALIIIAVCVVGYIAGVYYLYSQKKTRRRHALHIRIVNEAESQDLNESHFNRDVDSTFLPRLDNEVVLIRALDSEDFGEGYLETPTISSNKLDDHTFGGLKSTKDQDVGSRSETRVNGLVIGRNSSLINCLSLPASDLSSIESIHEVFRSLGADIGNTKFSFCLRDCCLGNQSLDALLINVVNSQVLLVALDLSDNSVGNDGVLTIGSWMASSATLTSLILQKCKISDIGIVSIIDFLRKDKSLLVLDLSYNAIERAGCQILASAFGKVDITEAMKTISQISDRTAITVSIGQQIEQVFNCTLNTLNLAGNAIEAGGAADLAKGMEMNRSLTSLDVGYQKKGKKIGQVGCTELASLLRPTDSVIKTLKMGRSNIGFEGARQLASVILRNSTLTELDIGNVNYLTIAGCMQLSQAILFNKKSNLAWLTIGERKLPLAVIIGDRALLSKEVKNTSASGTSIAQRLSMFSQNVLSTNFLNSEVYNPILHDGNEEKLVSSAVSPISMYPSSLDLQHLSVLSENKQFLKFTKHGMNDEMAVAIFNLVKNNKSLKYLRVDKTYLPIQSLLGFEKVKNFDFSGQELTSVDAIIIGGLLAENPHARTVYLENNKFSKSEGENFIGYALERNPLLKLDPRWPAARMYMDGYHSLASVQGISASGAVIEPQRLEGWFYQGLTAYAGFLFYVDLLTYGMTLYVFATQPKIYATSWLIASIILLCLPTLLYGYNTFVTIASYNFTEAFRQLFLIVFQLKAGIQAFECVKLSMESTEYLDYKYVQGAYKSVPSIFFKAYIMFRVGIKDNAFDIWVLAAILVSLFGITVIFTMLFDRKAARRMSMASMDYQPYGAVLVAKLFVYFGMGRDDSNVDGFVNFDAFYTSHYVWSYIYQILSLYTRVVSMSWMMAATDDYCPLLLFLILYSRYIFMLLFDEKIFQRSLFLNFVQALSLCITDSAWQRIPDDPGYSQFYFLGICALSSCENLVAMIYVTFAHHNTRIIPRTKLSIFLTFLFALTWRWHTLLNWTIRIHFPEVFAANSSNNNLFSKIMANVPKIGWDPLGVFSNNAKNKSQKTQEMTTPV